MFPVSCSALNNFTHNLLYYLSATKYKLYNAWFYIIRPVDLRATTNSKYYYID